MADNFGSSALKASDFVGWVEIARQVAADAPADVTRQLDVLDALFAFAAYEWDVRPNSENWLDYGRDGLALVRQLRGAAREDVELRTALGERLKAFPDEFVTCFDRCAPLDEEVLTAMAGMADDALDDPRAQLTYVDMVQSAARRSGQERLAETVRLLERSIDLAPRIAEPDWRKGALVRSFYDLQMFQRNGGHAAAADAAVTDLVAALSALEPAGVLNSDDRWCMKRLGDPATRERATDSCLTWAMTSGAPCFAADPWTADKDVALASVAYRTAVFLFAGLWEGTPKVDLLGALINRALYSNPYCPQVRYHLNVAVTMLENLAGEEPGMTGPWSEEAWGMLSIDCAHSRQIARGRASAR